MACVAMLQLGSISAKAASSITSGGSEFFTVTPFDWVVNVKVDEVSGVVNNLVEVFKDVSDVSGGLLEGEGQIEPGTTPALDAMRSPVDNSNAGGRARVIDTLENISDASGMFTGGNGDRVRITSTSNLQFELSYDGSESSVEAEAVICLMPIQLSIIRGGAVPAGQEAKATYRYYFEIDGNEIFSGSMSLTQSGSGVDLSSPDGAVRTDGVYFQDDTYNTIGFNFPAATYQVPMGIFDNGDPLEALLRFETSIEAPDNNWGAYAEPSSSTADPNMLIPIAVPEPGVAGLLAAGVLLSLFRRSRSGSH